LEWWRRCVVFAGFEMDAGCGGVGRGRTTTQEAVGPANQEKWAGPIQFGFTSWAAYVRVRPNSDRSCIA
jgi:hypothetical protein